MREEGFEGSIAKDPKDKNIEILLSSSLGG